MSWQCFRIKHVYKCRNQTTVSKKSQEVWGVHEFGKERWWGAKKQVYNGHIWKVYLCIPSKPVSCPMVSFKLFLNHYLLKIFVFLTFSKASPDPGFEAECPNSKVSTMASEYYRRNSFSIHMQPMVSSKQQGQEDGNRALEKVLIFQWSQEQANIAATSSYSQGQEHYCSLHLLLMFCLKR